VWTGFRGIPNTDALSHHTEHCRLLADVVVAQSCPVCSWLPAIRSSVQSLTSSLYTPYKTTTDSSFTAVITSKLEFML
jgi:hypothetical protein